jgi:hypothetical protein
MERLLAALIPVLCVVAFGPLFCSNTDMVADQTSASQVPGRENRSTRSKGSLCEVTR